MQLTRARFLVVLMGLSLAAGIAQAEPKRVLVAHSVEAESDGIVPSFVNLLGHFGCQVTTLPAAQYQAGKLAGYQALCYLGDQKQKLPQALLTDVYDAEIPVCWVGENLDQLATRYSLGRYGFRLTGKTSLNQTITYRSHRLDPYEPHLQEIVVDRPELCETLSEGERSPYAVRSGKFWYFSEMPLRGVKANASWLALADQLHDVLGEEHRPRRTAFLCVSDVNSLTEVRGFRAVVEALQKEGVPFALAVTPVYRDPARENDLRLVEQGDLVAALRRAQREGAAVIALGLTYQFAGCTGEEAEFWDEARRAPLLERSSEDTHRRLDLAITELAACELYPVAWATPRGLAAPADYSEMAQNFSTVWENRLAALRAPMPQSFPYLIETDGYGQRIVPGGDSTRLSTKHTARALLELAASKEAIRDPWVSFAIAPDASPQELRQLISGLRRGGWEFADLRKMDNWVKSTPLQIFSRAQATPLREVVPGGWNATLFLPGQGRDRRFERAAREGIAPEATLPPGAVVVTYLPGVELDEMFLPGGPGRRFTHRMATRVMGVVTLFAIGACVVFLALYLVQIMLQRRRI